MYDEEREEYYHYFLTRSEFQSFRKYLDMVGRPINGEEEDAEDDPIEQEGKQQQDEDADEDDNPELDRELEPVKRFNSTTYSKCKNTELEPDRFGSRRPHGKPTILAYGSKGVPTNPANDISLSSSKSPTNSPQQTTRQKLVSRTKTNSPFAQPPIETHQSIADIFKKLFTRKKISPTPTFNTEATKRDNTNAVAPKRDEEWREKLNKKLKRSGLPSV